MTKTSNTIRKLLLALTLAMGAAGVMAGPALAADWGHDRHDWPGRDWPGRDWHGRYWHAHAYLGFAPAPVYVAPGYAYPVAPPIVFAPPVAALNFVLPLTIR